MTLFNFCLRYDFIPFGLYFSIVLKYFHVKVYIFSLFAQKSAVCLSTLPISSLIHLSFTPNTRKNFPMKLKSPMSEFEKEQTWDFSILMQVPAKALTAATTTPPGTLHT